MKSELEILKTLMERVRDENDYFTPKQFYNVMKNNGYEIREVPHPIKKAVEKITDTAKGMLI